MACLEWLPGLNVLTVCGQMSQKSLIAEVPSAGGAAERRRLARCKFFALGAALSVLGLGVSVLGGWLFDIELLKRVHPAWATMKANSAFCFICAGFSLWLLNLKPATELKARLAQACALAVTIVGLLTLAEYLSGRDLGIDQLFIREHQAKARAPILFRMGVETALCFVFLGIALVILDVETSRGRWPSQHLVLASACVTLLGFVGNFYGVAGGYGIVSRGSVAFHTLIAFFLLCLGILLARPDRGIMANLSSDSIGGALTRRLLPAAFLLPVLVGWLSLSGEQAGLYGSAASSALFATSLLVVFGGLVSWTAHTLNRIELERWRTVESNLQLAAIVESSDDAIVSKNLDGIITTWNQGAERIFGYTAAEIVGQPISIVIPPDRLSEEPEILERLKRGERTEHFETVRKRKDGTLVGVSLTISPVKDSHGRIIGASKIVRDITERKRAEEALRRSEAHKTAILQTALDAILAVDQTATIREWNRGAETMFGYPKAEALGRKMDELIIPAEESEYYHGALVEYLATGVGSLLGRPFELTVMRREGTKFYCEFAITRNSWVEPTEYTCIIRDITERKRAEEALRESEERYRMLFNSMDEGFCTIEVLFDRNQKPVDFRFLEVNPAFEKQTGITEAKGKFIRQIAPNLEQHWFDIYGKIALTGEPARFDNPAKELHGWYEVYAYRVGRPENRHVAIFFNDITARKQMEDTLRKSEQTLEKTVAERTAALQASVAELEAFSYSLSHDMRAPLRAMRSFSQIVMAEYGEKLGAGGAELLEKVASAGGRLDRLIQDVLAFSQLAGQEIKLETVEVEDLMRQVIHERPEFQPPKADIQIQSPLLPVKGHQALLTQCVTNFLGNAVKFVDRGKQPRLIVRSEALGDEVRLWFEDNGIGIAKHMQERLFGIFQQLNRPGTYPGTGIGLAIVRKAAERMKGRVGVESEPGKGSRFWLQLPRGG